MKLEQFPATRPCRTNEPLSDALPGPPIRDCPTGGCRLCLIVRQDICFGIPGQQQLHAVHALVRRMYRQSGIEPPLGHDDVAAPSYSTLAAWHAEAPVGTLTLRADSEKGLLAEEIYPKEIDSLRQRGGHLFEITRLAVVPGPNTRMVLSTMFHLLCLFVGHTWTTTDVVIEVHPRHARLYSRLGGFRMIGELRTCRRVNAPAVLLHAHLDTLQDRIAEFWPAASGGHSRPCIGRGMHRHLLSPAEQRTVMHRLRQL